MREKYADQVRLRNWLALSPIIPEANLGDFKSTNDVWQNPNGCKCHRCSSEYHLLENFPQASSSNPDGTVDDEVDKDNQL